MQSERTKAIATDCGFFLQSQTNVRPTPNSDPKRVLLELTLKEPTEFNHDELIVETSRHHYSPQYAALTKEFHLRYA